MEGFLRSITGISSLLWLFMVLVVVVSIVAVVVEERFGCVAVA